ncbi:MAG: methyltransferase domain-containing protein [Actinobacteria bacterium]|nr:MAG: methyltransferase domain-containing protein [Actinomycetota bacterium]
MERTQSRPVTPRTAVVWAALRPEIEHRESLLVLDVGGGTGGFAVPLAEAGHRVTVVDASPDALAALTRRAADAGVADRIIAVQGDGDRLAELAAPASADLILCHSLLEVVDDPAEVNRAAAVLSRAMSGHLDVAAAALADPDGRTGPADKLRRRFDADGAAALLRSAGLTVEAIHGVRVLADLLPGAVADVDPEALVAFELAAADRPPFRDIATQLHLYARKPW